MRRFLMTGLLCALTASSALAQTPQAVTSDVGVDNGEASPQTPPASNTAPASDSIVLANGRVRFGTVLYGDWALYHQTGFGPQFVTQTNFPGPNNDGFNSFDVHRGYLNFFFMPSDKLTARVTPNIYREIGTVTADKAGATGAYAASVDGNLAIRLKYAYLEFGKVFDTSKNFKGTNIRLGQQMNPLIDWEEALYDYRFVNLVPWNYLSLSSTQVGASMNGAIGSNGKNYLDYQVGVFNNVSFHAFEIAENKQFMVRGSFYPTGAATRFQGLGITGFYEHGYTNNSPDQNSIAPVVRTATMAHFTTSKNTAMIAFEYDTGKNAFGTGNMFSGDGPQDLFGIGTTIYATQTKLWQSVLAGTEGKQKGWATLGRVNIPNTRLGVFGMYQYFQPNTNIPNNPLDFDRLVLGLAIRVSPRLRFALNEQQALYRHDQFTYPASDLATFNPSLAGQNPNGIPLAVPTSIKAFFASVEFTF